MIKVSAIFKTLNAGDGKFIVEFQGPKEVIFLQPSV